MYVSKLKKCKIYFKCYLFIYLLAYGLSIFKFNNTKDLIILFNFSTVIFCCIISQLIFIKQDKYIEKNYNELYQTYNYLWYFPRAITFRLLTYDKSFLYIPKEIKKLILETKRMLLFFLKVFLIIFLNTFVGGGIYIVVTHR